MDIFIEDANKEIWNRLTLSSFFSRERLRKDVHRLYDDVVIKYGLRPEETKQLKEIILKDFGFRIDQTR